MKNIKLLSAVLVLFTAFNFVSCSDVEPIDPAIDLTPTPDPENPVQTGTFKVDFDSQTYVATNVEASLENNILNLIAIKGTPPNLATFAMAVELTGTGIGTYPINIENVVVYQTINGTTVEDYLGFNPDDLSANVGSINITEVDIVNHKISGTFQFTGYIQDDAGETLGTKVFSNGVFNDIVFTTTTPTNPSADTFFAKVNGADFNEDQIDVAIVTQDDPATPENEGLPIHPAISIVGVKANGDTVGLSIHETLVPGTYQMTGFMNSEDMVNGSVKVGPTFLLSNSGSVTIISNDGVRIKGTFQFSATNFDVNPVWEISAGTFDVEIP